MAETMRVSVLSAAVTAKNSKIRVEIFLMAWSAMRTICALNWLLHGCDQLGNRVMRPPNPNVPAARGVSAVSAHRYDPLSLRIAVIGKDADDAGALGSRPREFRV
jgi:hypothetical protein